MIGALPRIHLDPGDSISIVFYSITNHKHRTSGFLPNELELGRSTAPSPFSARGRTVASASTLKMPTFAFDSVQPAKAASRRPYSPVGKIVPMSWEVGLFYGLITRGK